MSHHTLQKLVVRLLFDESFAAAVYQDPATALAGLELTESERAQVLRVDRRAWRHDALRQRRTLRTLVEEFKISTTVALAETRSLASLERFFSTPYFHQAVQERGSLAFSFSEFLLAGCRNGEWTAPQLPDLIRLETALAGCRRTLAREKPQNNSELPATISDRARIRLAPGYALGSFQANTIATIQHVERYLFELSLMPAMALCDDAPRLTGLPAVEAQKKVYLLFGPGAAGISLTELDKSSYLVLYETRRTSEIKSLLARLGPASARRAPEILPEWLEQGALMIIPEPV
jgi:hypothetical protein